MANQKKRYSLNLSDKKLASIQAGSKSKLVGYLEYILRTLATMLADNDTEVSFGLRDKVGYFAFDAMSGLPAYGQLAIFQAYRELRSGELMGGRMESRIRKLNLDKLRQQAKDEKFREELRDTFADVLPEMRFGAARGVIRGHVGHGCVGSGFPLTSTFIREEFPNPQQSAALIRNRPDNTPRVAKKVSTNVRPPRAPHTPATLADQLKSKIEEGSLRQGSGFVASENGRKYYRVGSSGARKLKGHLVHFESEFLAEIAGYVPSNDLVKSELATAA